MTETAPRAQFQSVEPARGTPDGEFEALFRAEFAYVWKTLRRLGVAERDLEDVTHDLFVNVFRRLGDYDRARPIRPWLCGFAARTASDYRRLARHRYEVGEGEAREHKGPGADEDGAFRAFEARDTLLKALDALDLERRVVVVMHDIDGHSMPDIAQALGVPLNTAYSRLRLARENLREALGRVRPEEVRHE